MAVAQFTITNISAATVTYQGQAIAPGGSFTPSAALQKSFASDPGVVADALAGTITIAVGNNNWAGNIAGQVLSAVVSGLNFDPDGNLIVTPVPGTGANFIFGDVTTSATTNVVVRRTVYTEQTSNAQRSIASASALDTAAGTGARTVMITYLDSTGAGPFTETLTLNGTTGVNTVATNICFIENIKVITAGSTGSNAGILTLYAAINKGGAVIGTVGATDNRTVWAHHYVPVNKLARIGGLSVSHSGTTVGSGAVFTIRSKAIGVADAIEIQVSDFHRLYGQSSTVARLYASPITLTGPARLQLYVAPETTSSTVYRASIDFSEQ